MSVESFFESHFSVMFGKLDTQDNCRNVAKQTQTNREPIAVLEYTC